MANKVIAIDPDQRSSVTGKEITGWQVEDVDYPELNQVLYQSVTDHVWGTSAQVTAGSASFYTDGSGNPLDASASAVTINEDDKILIKHDVTQTANLVLDAGGVKITVEMYGGVTLAMDTYDLTLGGSGDSVGGDIRLTQTGDLVIVGNRGLKVNNSVGVYEDFKTKKLIVNVQSSTTLDADADNIIFVDEFGGGKRVDGVDVTFDMTTDRPDGTGTTNELPSTTYQAWIDSDLNKALVPDLASTADGTTTSKLVDSAADFVTHLVHVGDIIFNLTDFTQTTVTAVDDLNTLSVSDDIFVSGKNYKIRMQSPVGLGIARARVCNAYNNVSSDLDDSAYTQIQEEKVYDGAGVDFTITGTAGYNTLQGEMIVSQVNDWTGAGEWDSVLMIQSTFTSTAAPSITVGGVVYKNARTGSVRPSANVFGLSQCVGGSGNVTLALGGAATSMTLFLRALLAKKPTFHN